MVNGGYIRTFGSHLDGECKSYSFLVLNLGLTKVLDLRLET
jgi:hypothetical protein